MNVADTEVVQAVLRGAGYTHAESASDADVVLLNTCAIRENAESKIWQRLRMIRADKRRAADGWRKRGEAQRPSGPVVGVTSDTACIAWYANSRPDGANCCPLKERLTGAVASAMSRPLPSRRLSSQWRSGGPPYVGAST